MGFNKEQIVTIYM